MKNNSITIRLSNEDIMILDSILWNSNISKSEYIRSLIRDSVHHENVNKEEIISALCKLYKKLEKLGIGEDEIAKEVKKLCQML